MNTANTATDWGTALRAAAIAIRDSGQWRGDDPEVADPITIAEQCARLIEVIVDEVGPTPAGYAIRDALGLRLDTPNSDLPGPSGQVRSALGCLYNRVWTLGRSGLTDPDDVIGFAAVRVLDYGHWGDTDAAALLMRDGWVMFTEADIDPEHPRNTSDVVRVDGVDIILTHHCIVGATTVGWLGRPLPYGY